MLSTMADSRRDFSSFIAFLNKIIDSNRKRKVKRNAITWEKKSDGALRNLFIYNILIILIYASLDRQKNFSELTIKEIYWLAIYIIWSSFMIGWLWQIEDNKLWSYLWMQKNEWKHLSPLLAALVLESQSQNFSFILGTYLPVNINCDVNFPIYANLRYMLKEFSTYCCYCDQSAEIHAIVIDMNGYDDWSGQKEYSKYYCWNWHLQQKDERLQSIIDSLKVYMVKIILF